MNVLESYVAIKVGEKIIEEVYKLDKPKLNWKQKKARFP